MNNIETMRLALEALESSRVFVTTREKIKHPEGIEWYDQRIAALRQAIEQAQQAEPFVASEETQRFAIQVEKLLCEKLKRKWSPAGISIQTLVNELADRRAQQAEPVAFASHGVVNWIADKQFQHEADLYTSPPPRQPLTPERVFSIADQHPVEGFDPDIMAFARAIEAAHGIKGEA